jgi:hypothetical protein
MAYTITTKMKELIIRTLSSASRKEMKKRSITSLNVACERRLMAIKYSIMPFCPGNKMREGYWCY